VLATDKLNRIKQIVHEERGGFAVVEAGVILSDLQRAVDHEGLLYPPDPTERGCFVGGNVATNASGARTFKYGPTRNYINRLKVVLASGEVLDLRRGEVRAAHDRIRLGKSIEVQLPDYRMPATRKNASAYFVAPEMDAVDLFIGSEGTLGVICEVEVKLLPKPEGLLSGVVFFADEGNVLALVREVRAHVDARAVEFFDEESLKFLRENIRRYRLRQLRRSFLSRRQRRPLKMRC
jgi:D-lactate dehydrogenase (cytochrome)